MHVHAIRSPYSTLHLHFSFSFDFVRFSFLGPVLLIFRIRPLLVWCCAGDTVSLRVGGSDASQWWILSLQSISGWLLDKPFFSSQGRKVTNMPGKKFLTEVIAWVILNINVQHTCRQVGAFNKGRVFVIYVGVRVCLGSAWLWFVSHFFFLLISRCRGCY